MSERDAFTHLIWDDEMYLDDLIEEIGHMILATAYANNIQYPDNITGNDKHYLSRNFYD